MININQLKGTNLKKDVGLHRVLKRWHNHNKTGGNFGINLYPMDHASKKFEITGEHDTDGTVRRLRFGELYQVGQTLFDNEYYSLWDYDKLVCFIKNHINAQGDGTHD